MAKPLIAPSILSADHARLAAEISAVEKAGADWIHVDVMDGHFVPNLTWGPPVIASLKPTTRLPLDVHLMIEEPERSIEQYVRAGADRITVHVEATVHLHRTLSQIRDLGALPGVALNPSTPVSSIVNVLHLVDLVLIMTVNPGFGGQSFIAETLPKIRHVLMRLADEKPNALLQVDGGVDPKTVGEVTRAGANVLVAGNAIFGETDYAATISSIRKGSKAYEPEPVDMQAT